MAHVVQSTSVAFPIKDELEIVPEGLEAQFSEREDYRYELGSDAEDEGDDEDNDEANSGPEDGEEPWEVDDLHAEGYDEL